jgi:hypothetical protein
MGPQLEQEPEVFLADLDESIKWEKRWEKQARFTNEGVNWFVWMTRIGLLLFSMYLVRTYVNEPPPSWLIWLLISLSAANIGLPLLPVVFRWQQRQEVYDRNAREFSCIKTGLNANLLTSNNRSAGLRRPENALPSEIFEILRRRLAASCTSRSS